MNPITLSSASLRLCASILTLILATSLISAAEPKTDAASRCNIVLIFIDDMGYGDIGPFGNTVNKTPHLDRMAKEGNVLRQFYVSNNACTPSRAALLTGTYAHRIGMDGGVVFPGQDRGLNPAEITIAEMLKERGYATGCFGKWHLGDQPEFLPPAQGFDEYFGIPYSNDMWPGNKRGNPVTNRGSYEPLPIMRGKEAVAYVADAIDQSLLCEVVTDEAVKFIERHKDGPFFCFVPHAYIHNPRFARPEIMARAEGDTRRANIEEVDDSVGRILDTLRKLNLAENTLVMFTSDNGGAEIGPLRGKKMGPKYEGNMREPTLTWWPGTIVAGTETEAIATTTDLLPSLAKLTGAKVPADRTIDGRDALDILLGKPDSKSPHKILYYETTGIRRGDWKLVRKKIPGKGMQSELYNLKDDLGERNNIAAKHPDLVKELVDLLTTHTEAVAADTRPAGFAEDARPILTKPGNLPRLREFMGLPDTTIGGALSPKTPPKPIANAGANATPPAPADPAKSSRPNFVVILADDQGWNALSTRMDPQQPGSGSTYYQTSNLGQLAAQGMRFSQAYAPAPTCSPTRHAIQFGRSPASLKIFGADRITDWDATNDESLARVLKRADPAYVCAHLGKWHIGRSPEALGFDLSDGMTGNGTGNSTKPDDPKLIYDLSKRSNRFIEQQVAAGKPFFLQISHYANHLKYQAKAETVRKYESERATHATPYQNRPLWAAMNENLDEGIGMVLDHIESLGIADNTYVIYTADNGYELKRDSGKPVADRQFYQAFPQRSHKYTVSEGGIRVPFIVRGPGIPEGAHSGSPVVGTDIFATIMDLAGGSKHLPPRVEGASLAAHLTSGGKETIKRRDDFLVFKYSKPNGRHDVAIVRDHYKLIKDIDAGESYLFDLAQDVGERHDLAGQQPERARQLDTAMTSYLARFGWDESQAETGEKPGRPSKKKAPNPTSKIKNPDSGTTPPKYTPAPNDLLIADFEGENYGTWKVSGTAFGNAPSRATTHRNRITGFLGKGFVNTYLDGDKTTGELTSPPFKIERRHINFLIGGGRHPGQVGVQLQVDGKIVRSATGRSRKNARKEETLHWHSFDVREFIGKAAVVRIIDQRSGGWGHTVIDHIFQSDRAMQTVPAATSEAPPNPNAPAPDPVPTFPPPVPGVTLKDEWSTFPLYQQVGYNQALRPQFHFTSRMGWLNDPNGMVYSDGEWHMFFQHVAVKNNTGPKSWGTAKSTDLMHWTQYPHAINPYPNLFGKEGDHTIWSGSAVADVHNALGKQQGDVKTLFALYTATNPDGFFQGGAFSTDRGRTWTKIDRGKPVIPHQEGFSKGQRDPRIFYHAPAKCYYTIMMIGGPERKVRLWRSTNLLDWKPTFDIPNKAAECIDMFAVAVDGNPNTRKWVIADANTHYEVGDFDGKSWKGLGDKDQDGKRRRFDVGDSWYAAQAFNQGPDGRVVHIGWLRSKQAGYRPFLEAGMPFTQQMSIPIEITLRTTPDGIRMFRNPVREIEALHQNTTVLDNLRAKEANAKLAALNPELIDLTLRFVPENDFTLNLRGLPVRYDAAKRQFTFTNTARVQGEKAAWKKAGPYRDNGLRTIPAPPADGKVTIRALVDRASLELFVNDGAAAASFVVVPDPADRRITIEGNDALRITSLIVHELESAWGTPRKVAPSNKATAAPAAKPHSR